MDSSIPLPAFRLTQPGDASGLREWLGMLGLSDLAETLLSADERENWVLDDSDSDFRQRVDEFYSDLQNVPHEDAHRVFPEERALIDILASTRASRAIQVLAAVNERYPGFVEQVLKNPQLKADASGVSGPSEDPALNVFLTRLVYLLRLDAIKTIFSSPLRAEVRQAIEKAEGEDE